MVHRDLKLDNLLLAKKGDIATVKIADFGFAKKRHPFAEINQLKTVCGTPGGVEPCKSCTHCIACEASVLPGRRAEYLAPEVARAGRRRSQAAAAAVYGPPCDLWSCGVILFMLLGGYPPFWHDSHPCLLRAISSGKFGFDDPVWRDVSGEAKDLICRLLVVDPAKRLTSKQACRAAALQRSAGLPCTGLCSHILHRRMQVLTHPWSAGRGTQHERRLPQTAHRIRHGIIDQLRRRPSERSRLHQAISAASAPSEAELLPMAAAAGSAAAGGSGAGVPD